MQKYKCNNCGFGVVSKINNELFMVLIFLLMILAPTSCHNFFWERNHVLGLLPTVPLADCQKTLKIKTAFDSKRDFPQFYLTAGSHWRQSGSLIFCFTTMLTNNTPLR